MATVPTIHMNGTDRDRLADQVSKAFDALNEAMAAMCDAAPNARDYYPQGPGAFERARAEHEDRLRRIGGVCDEMQALSDAIARGRR